jgi:hypothetical protein
MRNSVASKRLNPSRNLAKPANVATMQAAGRVGICQEAKRNFDDPDDLRQREAT